MGNLLLSVKVILMALSFLGLCGFVKRHLDLDGTVVPLAAASGVIVLLMLAGMVHALQWAWWFLFAGGLAGFAWFYVLRREKPANKKSSSKMDLEEEKYADSG